MYGNYGEGSIFGSGAVSLLETSNIQYLLLRGLFYYINNTIDVRLLCDYIL